MLYCGLNQYYIAMADYTSEPIPRENRTVRGQISRMKLRPGRNHRESFVQFFRRVFGAHPDVISSHSIPMLMIINEPDEQGYFTASNLMPEGCAWIEQCGFNVSKIELGQDTAIYRFAVEEGGVIRYALRHYRFDYQGEEHVESFTMLSPDYVATVISGILNGTSVSLMDQI